MSDIVKNKDVAAKWLMAVFNEPEKLDDVKYCIAEDNKVGFSRLKASWAFLHARYTDVSATILDQVAERDKVFTRLRVEGVAVDAGDKCTWDAFCFHTIANGAIVGGVSGAPAALL